jgi:hypothetical protein
MISPNDNIRVIIPLSIHRRNGRPKILPAEDVLEQQQRGQHPHILKALGRAWASRRKLESGEAAAVGDIAKAEKVTNCFVSRAGASRNFGGRAHRCDIPAVGEAA